MIPLYKLEKLPRTQKLRKLAKIFTMAENRLCQSNAAKEGGKGFEIYSEAELVFFTDAAKLLSKDDQFQREARKMFTEAANFFNAVVSSHSTGKYSQTGDTALADEAALFRRILNNVKHILLAETGKDQSDWDFTCSDGKLDLQKRQIIEGMQVYMEDIRSPFNIGAMFRTAESFGVEKIFLSPFCADPRHTRAERTAMGCIDIIPWERKELASILEGKIPVFALETGGIPLAEFKFPQRGLLITGSEELGVSPQALTAADASLGRVSIPCYGTKASLNVSVAFGIAVQAWRSALSA